ncbi:MAG: 16S rRNA processing protein RimM [Chloroflexi bacterium]|nr:16S rRNA processing protein RimM [Chloroflexota bacterium]
MSQRPRASRHRRAGRRIHVDDAHRAAGRIIIGRLRKPHGVRGEMNLEVLTDHPEARFYPGAVIFVGPRQVPLTLRSVRPSRQGLLVAFEGYPDRNAVEIFRNQWVTIPAEEAAAPEADDEYYDFELLGLQVVTEDGRVLGPLVEILETGANDVFIVQPESGPPILLPVIDEVVRGWDLEAGRIVVRLLPGLLPDQGDT